MSQKRHNRLDWLAGSGVAIALWLTFGLAYLSGALGFTIPWPTLPELLVALVFIVGPVLLGAWTRNTFRRIAPLSCPQCGGAAYKSGGPTPGTLFRGGRKPGQFTCSRCGHTWEA
jgi:hypothetical protein